LNYRIRRGYNLRGLTVTRIMKSPAVALPRRFGAPLRWLAGRSSRLPHRRLTFARLLLIRGRSNLGHCHEGPWGSERTLGVTAQRPRRRRPGAYLRRVCVSADTRDTMRRPAGGGARCISCHGGHKRRWRCPYTCCWICFFA
jgi:hypothetical protein